MKIPFNKPYLSGNELSYIAEAVKSGHISGNGNFTKKCQQFFESRYGFGKTLLTSSCTDALEMAAILLNISAGDEVIIPSYTFVSSANPFVLRGAKIVFADSQSFNPNVDAGVLESLITPRTKAIVVVHYAGVACDMEAIKGLCKKHNLKLVEDCAHSIESFYNNKPLGSFGQLAAFSFHETKNIQCGEGGLLAINDSSLYERAEIIWEKGTNRSKFFRGEIAKYDWVDIGSSFLAGELSAAFLFAQLENLEQIQGRRKSIWQRYHDLLKPLEPLSLFTLPKLPSFATLNGHLFFLQMKDEAARESLQSFLAAANILAVSHYRALHQSAFYTDKHDGRALPEAEKYTATILRLPLYFELTEDQQNLILQQIKDWCTQQS